MKKRKEILKIAAAITIALFSLHAVACSGNTRGGSGKTEYIKAPASTSDAEKPVVFIADGGIGDGSSAESPLMKVSSGNVFRDADESYGASLDFYDSLLYQATALLYGTGGTIVICGEVRCNAEDGIGSDIYVQDLTLPYCGGGEITITSVYGGVDYRKTNGARLVLETPVCLITNNPVTFDGIDICTAGNGNSDGSGRIIAGCGFRTVIGENVRCIPLDCGGNEISDPDKSLYPNIAGGQRFAGLTSDTELILKGGTFNNVCAGSYGISYLDYAALYGSSSVTISGDTKVLGTLSGTTFDSAGIQYGDIEITLDGGYIGGNIVLCSNAGMGARNCIGILNINAGTLSESTRIVTNSATSNYLPGYSLLNCAAYEGASTEIAAASSGFDEIVFSSSDVISAEISSFPARVDYRSGDLLDTEGLTVLLKTEKRASNVSVSRLTDAFRFISRDGQIFDPKTDALTVSDTGMSLYYGEVYIGDISLNVKERPQIEILGAAISTVKGNGEIGFYFRVNEGNADTGTEIQKTGIVMYTEESGISYSDIVNGKTALASIGAVESYEISADMYSEYTGNTEGLYYASLGCIPAEEYDAAMNIAAFYTYTDGGIEYTAYSEPYLTSVYSVAANALNDSGVKSGMKEKLKASVTDFYIGGDYSENREELIFTKIEEMLDYFKQMSEVRWICPEDINYAGECLWSDSLQYKKGVSYRGITYTAGKNGRCSLEEFLSYLDEDGRYSGSTEWDEIPGNNCTTSVFQALSRVTDTYDYWDQYLDPVLHLIQLTERGTAPFIKVGDYEIKPTSALTTLIIEESGSTNEEARAVIFGGYAAAKRGDFLYSYWNSAYNTPMAHIRIVSDIHIEKDKNGAISGSRSYIKVYEQTSTADSVTTWGIDRKYTFEELYRDGYLVARDSSFENGYFPTAFCAVSNANTPYNIQKGLSGTVTSNYDITEVRLCITDAKTGRVVFDNSLYGFFERSFNISELDPDNSVADLYGSFTYSLTVTTAGETKEYVGFKFNFQ